MNVLIIGGSSDIGVSFGKYYVSLGYNVLVSYNKNKIDIPGVVSFKCDVKKEEDIENIILKGIELFGKIDLLINMAAISLDNDFFDKSKKEFMEVLEVNLVGTFLVNQIYSRYINDGMIINVASTDGINTGSRYNIDYSASKAGIIGMSKGISLATSNKVICICPNWIDSESTRLMDKGYLDSELKRIGQSRLIRISEMIDVIDNIIDSEVISGDIYRIDVKDDKLWVEKMY